MAEDTDIIQKLKDAGMTCSRLDDKINSNIKDIEDFRKLGWSGLANTEETVVNKLREVKKQVCRLR